ncbi:DUF6571 family protein [Streptomyces tirandamycinicus]|uniref:DUF6571 domain-containing protein n=1 Tax=Streptomyces tirandamycinicus TaxID=2174846 RepID=A0A2S1SYJ6_9ACTN|nr:DUF6571 family protein [Streptomyces tirandamycinicus]AWI31307.1 hypothetical protein DDW44_22890 [Streptomyces tirandamycinicus]
MDLETLRFAKFGLLDEAVTDWTTLIGKLAGLKEDADDGLRVQANKSNWTGENEKISKQFIGRTAGEFADAHTQATSIRNILRDTCSELKGYQAKLNEAIERGLRKNLTVVSTAGGGFTVSMNIHPDRAGKGTSVPSHTEADVTALRDEVQQILDGATRSDSSATRVLTALVDQSKLGFSDNGYADRDTATDALREADSLAKLAKKNPEDLTVEEFDRLNAGLKRFAGDGLFAEHFAKTLGGKGTLEFWADLNRPMVNPELMHERREQMADLQKNLGLTLATASRSDTAAMETWKRDVVAFADRPLEKNGGMPFGGQVMSNLMRWGDYDDTFLNEYGNKLVAAEKKLTHNGAHVAWQPLGIDPQLNHTGTDTGWDPMTGYFKALANNPHAATEFFGDTFLTKDEDHDFKVEGKDDRRSLSNFEYFFEERDWPHDYDKDREESIAGRNNLAMALEAATTGHPAGEMPTADLPPHSAAQAQLMESLVASIAEDDTRLTKHGHMSDSMGQIASEYLPDINRATTDTNADPQATQGEKTARDNVARLFPLAGSAAILDHRDVSRFLLTIGQDPDGYAAVQVGQKAYMTNLMDYHLNPDLPEAQRYSGDQKLLVHEIAHSSGEVSAALNVGRQEALAGAAEDADKKYEQSVAKWKSGISGGIGTGIGVGVSFIATPVVGAVVGGGATTVSGVVLEHVFQDAEGKAKDEAGPKMGEKWENGLEDSIKYAVTAADTAASAHGLPHGSDLVESARTGSRNGYDLGGGFTESVAKDLQTDI